MIHNVEFQRKKDLQNVMTYFFLFPTRLIMYPSIFIDDRYACICRVFVIKVTFLLFYVNTKRLT